MYLEESVGIILASHSTSATNASSVEIPVGVAPKPGALSKTPGLIASLVIVVAVVKIVVVLPVTSSSVVEA